VISVATALVEGDTIRRVYRLEKESILQLSVLMPLLKRLIIFSAYRLLSIAMLIIMLVKPYDILNEGTGGITDFVAFSEIVQAAGPLVAFIILSTRSDVLTAWRLRRQPSSIQVMENVDRDRIFRKNLTPSWILSPRTMENGELDTVVTEEPGSMSEWEASMSSESQYGMALNQDYQKPLPTLPSTDVTEAPR